MAATTHTPAHGAAHDSDAHPSRDKLYVLIALFLGALTVIEVLTYTHPALFGGAGSAFMVAALLVLMVVKFWTVAWFFMHLKFDKKILSVVFYSGLLLAVGVYIAIFAAFRFWGPPENHMVPGGTSGGGH